MIDHSALYDSRNPNPVPAIQKVAIDITRTDNPADVVITLKITGNYLVSVCNTIQQLIHEKDAADKEHRKQWYAEVNEVVERMRDQLSHQRMLARGYTEEQIAETNARIRAATRGREKREKLEDLRDLVASIEENGEMTPGELQRVKNELVALQCDDIRRKHVAETGKM